MYLGLDARSKLRVCGFPEIEKFKITTDEEEKLKYLSIIKATDTNKQYLDFLYLYGVYMRELKLKANTPIVQEIAKRKDKDSEIWFKLCTQLETLLMQASPGSFFYKTKKDQPKRELFFTSIESKQQFNDLLIKFCIQELYEFEYKFKVTHGYIKAELIEPENITLEIVQQKIADYYEARKQILGKEKGQPTDANTLHSYIITYLLSYLLKIDKLLSAPIEVGVDRISHADDDYLFIYNFLDFFDLLEYKKSNPDVTTTSKKVIKSRLDKFPKTNNPEAYDQLLSIELRMSIYANEMKRLKNQRINDLGKVF
ncbi:hypothetical protein LJC54_03030 [Parabacteroides sp. OttesenSCG-928-J18]|nr:hypothetical protein [Parabacteroides sp. OttesenSCG-928-J18]